ncbi:co-chaperone p23 [Plasmodium gonderi]|uniref:Co-chaperone p23 n=1 Tax=Plasmodium gonderi TaxID=77519 RepID=A0A1Y1JKW3_PLAGO|nr:co-chaperone p23 [Plasmodium gonderi]GAW80684.1 co-chaperone p23 [Plasmodium gonderi]
MLFFCFFFIYTLILQNVVLSKLNFQNEQLATSFFEANKNYHVTKEDIIDGIEKCWFNVTNYLINQSIKQEKDFSNDVKMTVNSMKQKLDQLITVSYSIKKIDTVNASFQWAQSPEHIFLNIKFSHRWSSPGALKVKDEQVISKKNIFSFSAMSNDSNSVTKKYIVDLTLLHDIIESETKYNFASVGKVVVTLKKKQKQIWSRLLSSRDKNPNMQVWWDMKEKYHDSVQSFLKEEEEKKKKETKNGNKETETIHNDKNEMNENEFGENKDVQNGVLKDDMSLGESKKKNSKYIKDEEL